MGEILTVEEIGHRYQDEWVFLADPQMDENNHVLAGRLIAHSRDRDEIGRVAIERKLKSSAVFYTGPVSNHAVVIL